MSDETKKKYKVLLPTNGLEVGSVVELTDAEAEGYNANEPNLRVEAIIEPEPAPEAIPEIAPEPESEPTTPSPEPSAVKEGEGEGGKVQE